MLGERDAAAAAVDTALADDARVVRHTFALHEWSPPVELRSAAAAAETSTTSAATSATPAVDEHRVTISGRYEGCVSLANVDEEYGESQ